MNDKNLIYLKKFWSISWEEWNFSMEIQQFFHKTHKYDLIQVAWNIEKRLRNTSQKVTTKDSSFSYIFSDSPFVFVYPPSMLEGRRAFNQLRFFFQRSVIHLIGKISFLLLFPLFLLICAFCPHCHLQWSRREFELFSRLENSQNSTPEPAFKRSTFVRVSFYFILL